MKTLLIATLLSATVQADTFFTRMENGATLVLTTEKNDCIYGLSAVTLNIKGKVALTSCWEVTGENVKVYYTDGETRDYPINTFYMIAKKQEIKL